MPTKKYLRKNVKKLCLMGQIVIHEVTGSGILTEPLNPRVLLSGAYFPLLVRIMKYIINNKSNNSTMLLTKKIILTTKTIFEHILIFRDVC